MAFPARDTAEPTPPVAPTAEQWEAMSLAEREACLEDTLLALQQYEQLMPSEGTPHINAKFGIRQLLGDWYQRIGRAMYLATELPVHYPGEPIFAPDLFAVADVEAPGDADTRMAWVVVEERRGLDLVLEVLHAGSRKKDLKDNVDFYAHLAIPEYFVYDRKKLQILGWHLPFPGARRYERIALRGGFLPSRVLALDLAVVNGRLRFFHGGAEIPETRELLGRVTAMVEELERRAEAEAQRAEAEAQRAEAEAQARAELQRRLDELLKRSS